MKRFNRLPKILAKSRQGKHLETIIVKLLVLHTGQKNSAFSGPITKRSRAKLMQSWSTFDITLNVKTNEHSSLSIQHSSKDTGEVK